MLKRKTEIGREKEGDRKRERGLKGREKEGDRKRERGREKEEERKREIERMKLKKKE